MDCDRNKSWRLSSRQTRFHELLNSHMQTDFWRNMDKESNGSNIFSKLLSKKKKKRFSKNSSTPTHACKMQSPANATEVPRPPGVSYLALYGREARRRWTDCDLVAKNQRTVGYMQESLRLDFKSSRWLRGENYLLGTRA